MKKIVITGANGFVGRNFFDKISDKSEFKIESITRADNQDQVLKKIDNADFIFHLAAVNRPKSIEDIDIDNVKLTESILHMVKAISKNVVFILSSSTQATMSNAYGLSKLKAENILHEITPGTKITSIIYRFPGLFGKWCRPNYNSVVATYCFNIIRGLPIVINDPNHLLKLVYIDDVIEDFVDILFKKPLPGEVIHRDIGPINSVKLDLLAVRIREFDQLYKVGEKPILMNEFDKKLYFTFLSYLP